MRSGEAVFAREDEQTILAVVRHAFETARAQAALLATGKGSAAAQREGGGTLSGKAAQLKAAIQGDEEGIEQLRRRLRAAPRASRPALQDALVAATNRLELDRVRLDFMTRLEEFKVSSSDTEPDLGHQIQTLEEAVPELRSPSPAASATVVPRAAPKAWFTAWSRFITRGRAWTISPRVRPCSNETSPGRSATTGQACAQ